MNRNSSAFEKYSKKRSFPGHWDEEVKRYCQCTDLQHTLHCTVLTGDTATTSVSPSRPTLQKNTELYWLYKWHCAGNHHIPKSSHTQAPAFRYQPWPSCPSHKKRFEPNTLHKAYSVCHRNCHSNAAFPAAWYTMQQAPGGDIITRLAAELQNHVVVEALKLLPRHCHSSLLIQNENFTTL